jgi:Winged helix DNA-binding domain
VPLTWDSVRGRRLAHQHLLERVPAGSMLDVVAGICGIHAQVPSYAELQLWARVEGVRPEDVREGLWSRRSLVRTWSMRGTLHILTAQDLPLYVAALRTNDRWWKGAWLRHIGFSAEELRAILDAIADALGPEPLTRQQLADKVVERAGARATEHMLSGWAEMLKPAAFAGALISGPPDGQSVTFVHPKGWLGGWEEIEPEHAWREIVRRYLRAYGPAAREEFGRWWGIQAAPAGHVLARSRDELVEVDVEGYRAFTLAADVDAMAAPAAPAPLRLLPGFDPYVVGTRPRSSLVDRFEERVFRKAGWISPVVLIDGMVAGIWTHERAAGRVEVTVEPFRELRAEHRREIAEEADRLGSFLDAPATVSYRTSAASDST